jgi:hypothetical protein
MATSRQHSPSYLALLFAEGERDDELVTVAISKCLIPIELDLESVLRCTIFRGPRGVAVRAFDSQVAFNGEIKSVHWLKDGDRIDFANAVAMEVPQLGKFQSNYSVSTNLATNVDIARIEEAERDSLEDHRLSQIRMEASMIQTQNKSSSAKFEFLDEKLNLLTDHLNELIYVAKEGHFLLRIP